MFEFVYEYADKDTVIKYLRLSTIICFYLFFRTYYAKWAQRKQLDHQLATDKKEKETKASRKAAEEEEYEQKLKTEAASFGWGKKTRMEVKMKQQHQDNEAETLRQRYQSAYDAAEDHDIEDLLED